MTLDIPPLMRLPLVNRTASSEWRDSVGLTSLTGRSDTPGTIYGLDGTSPSAPDMDYGGGTQLSVQDMPSGSTARQLARRHMANPGMLADSMSWDQSRPLYNPRGAPSDASPALTRLEARIALEPNYVHQYASTRYANVSVLPWLLAERKMRVDILV